MLLRHQLWSFWWDYRCSNEGNMEINSNLLIISETIARTMSSATTLLLCSHSVHLKPRESEFIFWRDFSHNNPQQCDPLSREGASSSSSRCTRSSPHLWGSGVWTDFKGSYLMPPSLPSSISSSRVSSIRSEELAQGNRFIGKHRLNGVSGVSSPTFCFHHGTLWGQNGLCRTLFRWILKNLQVQRLHNLSGQAGPVLDCCQREKVSIVLCKFKQVKNLSLEPDLLLTAQ